MCHRSVLDKRSLFLSSFLSVLSDVKTILSQISNLKQHTESLICRSPEKKLPKQKILKPQFEPCCFVKIVHIFWPQGRLWRHGFAISFFVPDKWTFYLHQIKKMTFWILLSYSDCGGLGQNRTRITCWNSVFSNITSVWSIKSISCCFHNAKNPLVILRKIDCTTYTIIWE